MDNKCELVYDNAGRLTGYQGALPGYSGVKARGRILPEELAALSKQSGGIEFCATQDWHFEGTDGQTHAPRYRPGDFWVHSGSTLDPLGVSVPIYRDAEANNIAVYNLYHTHPTGKTAPSISDLIDLAARAWQQESGIVTWVNEIVVITMYNLMTRPE